MASVAESLKKIIAVLGFAPQDGTSGVYLKSYSSHGAYQIYVDFNEEKIDYAHASISLDQRILLGDLSTSNFSHPENIVVLECVDRLLEKGYAPHCLELEKVYPSGRGHSGRLDILVKSPDGTPFMMIECKTWGIEYKKERDKMLRNGGQLFTYYKNATATKHLCLYTSRLVSAQVDYSNSIVDVRAEWAGLSETKDIYDYWNKTFTDNGIFESYAAPYNVVHKRLTYGMLQNMREEDSGKIYNHIMEILRHNGISDKPNAFNKLLNLFVCKIIDEDKNPDDELEFQCWEGLSDEDLQLTLNDLYKDGMWRFLNIDVIDHSMDEVTEKLEGFSNTENKSAVLSIIRDLRLKKSPNFAFVEVLDDRTFLLNAKVVREIVELLQGYRFRYEQKHEFLGNFFELLLNTSMKQEAGQFFTPVPITRFIISSIPSKEFVQGKIDAKAADPLPTVIDYACGSGHFLTEFMSQMQTIIETAELKNAAPRIRNKLNAWRGDVKFSWASEYIYGIDFDNRLVKTTKVSAFFNGDGEATVIWGNGLDNFEHSGEYRDKLKRTLPGSKKDNGQFDILISNPPYSVQAFKSMLRNGKDTFDLYEGLTDNSSEIECLFIERMKQLLKVGGWAGVILPSSILSNGGIYSRAREIIFKYFKVISIVELGSGTFMKTGTNTVILFLERRPDSDHAKISQAIDRFFRDGQDVTVLGIENAFSKFVSGVYESISFEDYASFVRGAVSDGMKKYELWLDYVKEFGEELYKSAFEIEREKLLYFLLTCEQNIVLVKSGQKKDEKAFLGYEFSERRGYEGIKRLPCGTLMFDEDGAQNPQKVNSYIYNAFLGKSAAEVDEALVKYVSYGHMSGLFEYGTRKFDRRVNLRKKTKVISKWPIARLGDLLASGILKSDSGFVFSKDLQGNQNRTDIPFYKVSDLNSAPANGVMGISANYIDANTLKDVVKGRVFPEKSIIFPKVGQAIYTNKKRLISIPAVCDNNIMAIWAEDSREWAPKYLFEYFNAFVRLADFASTANPPSISIERLSMVKIPHPPMSVQQKIIAEYEAVEAEIERVSGSIDKLRGSIERIASDESHAFAQRALSQIVAFNLPRSEIADMDENTTISFVDMASVSNDGFIAASVERKLSEVRKGGYTYFRENDIIIAKITPCMENGKCALAVGLKNGIGMGSTEFHVLRCGEKVLPKYLFVFLNRPSIREAAQQQMTGASGHRRVPVSFYEQLSISLPPIENQREVVAKVEKWEAEITRLHEWLDELKAKKVNILQKHL